MRRGDDVKHLPSFYFASGRRYLGNRWCRTERSEVAPSAHQRSEWHHRHISEAKWHHRHISEASGTIGTSAKRSGTIGTSAKRVAPSAHQQSEWHHRRHWYNHHYKRGINLSRHKQIRDASFHFTDSTTSPIKISTSLQNYPFFCRMAYFCKQISTIRIELSTF